jgi:myo-inositol-1-phosphate synthase
MRGPTLDGISETCRTQVAESSEAPTDVTKVLRESGTELVVSYLPVGSDDATSFYANAALEAGCGYINCMPTPIASSPAWEGRFKAAGLPLVGDDVKSQLGATVLHRALARLFIDRGVEVTSSFQLNVGGNSDFLNMHAPQRGAAKENSKLVALESIIPDAVAQGALTTSVGYVPSLGDRKTAYIHLEGAAFGLAPVGLDVKLDVWDSPNSAGVVVDAIRFAKLALETGQGGAVIPACAYLMKSPPIHMDEALALRELEAMSGG